MEELTYPNVKVIFRMHATYRTYIIVEVGQKARAFYDWVELLVYRSEYNQAIIYIHINCIRTAITTKPYLKISSSLLESAIIVLKF